jgi:hypothetical protein
MKPIIFAGDSWTFGEGLELYNSTYYNFVYNYFTKNKHLLYNWPNVESISSGGSCGHTRSTHRFASIVSEYFKTSYFSKNENGGDNTWAIDYIEYLIDTYDENSFSYIVFQFTDMFRDLYSQFFSKLEIVSDDMGYLNIDPPLYRNFLNLWESWESARMGLFINQIDEYDKMSQLTGNNISYDLACRLQKEYSTYFNFINELFISQYDSYYRRLSRYKIPIICIGTWSPNDASIIKELDSESISFFKDRMVLLENNEITSNYMADLCDFNGNQYPYDDMLIGKVWEWTDNLHPTQKFHKIIANSIIKHIKNLESTT